MILGYSNLHLSQIYLIFASLSDSTIQSTSQANHTTLLLVYHHMEKKELRAQVRQKKSAYTPAQLVEISVSIIEKLKVNSKFHAAHTICLYSSLPDEVDTHPLIEELKSEKRILSLYLICCLVGQMPSLVQQQGLFGCNL